MNTRRNFLKRSVLCTSMSGLTGLLGTSGFSKGINVRKPVVMSTWEHGLAANEAAWKMLQNSGKSIDAVEAGVKVSEADPNVNSVGYGGYPDADGRLTLDACIMDENQQCGSVACLEHIMHPVSVARLVMEQTRHVMLVGEGALQFALQHGFTKQNLITEKALRDWEALKEEMQQKRSIINIENHDTIGMLALDEEGNLAGSCTTSGAAVKLHGRVGDSPIIGAGLFVDNEVGAACATGLGEEVIKQSGSAMIVELMRNGMEPALACREILQRILKANKNSEPFQVGFLALRKDGLSGAYSINKGFNYALHDQSGNRLIDSPFMKG